MNNRMTRRTAVVLVALMMIAVPATAAVITQNFMKADITLQAACFTKTAGTDATPAGENWMITFTESTTVDAGGGVTLLQETTEVHGFAGDRMIYSDAVRFRNDCGHQIQVSLVSQNDAAGDPALEPAATVGSIWDDVNVKIYLATAPGDPGIPSDGAAGWRLMMTVDNGGTVTSGGDVNIGSGTEHQLAFVIDTQAGLTPIPVDPAILRWTAQAVHP